MDLIELLVLLAFVFFPLLQALLERLGKRGRDAQLPPPAPEDGPVAAEARIETRAEEVWSSGWGSWPSEEGATTEAVDSLEELTAKEVVTEDQADELIAYQERLAARQMSEAARVTVPVVSMESLRVEHRRPTPTAIAPPPRRPRPGARLAAALRTPDELRRAVLLSEILGPPRALQ